MSTTIKARFSEGVLKPLGEVELKEGEEVSVTITPLPRPSGDDWLEKTAGSWVGLIDSERLKREIYESRLLANRPEPRL